MLLQTILYGNAFAFSIMICVFVFIAYY